MIDFRRHVAGCLIRHVNRREPLARVPRRRPDIYVDDDGATVSIAHMTRAEAMQVYRLCCTSPQLFGMTFAVGQMLGIDGEMDA